MGCAELNVQVSMTVNSRVIKTFLAWSPDAVDVPLMNGLRVQILPTVEDLPRARKNQFAAFIASEALLVVWDDDPAHLVERAKAIEQELMQLVWDTGEPKEGEDESDEKKIPRVTEYEVDSESGEIVPEARSTNLMNTILVGFTLIIVVTLLGLGARSLAIEVSVDHDYTRLAFLALTPVQVFFTLVSYLIRQIVQPADRVTVLLPSYCWLYRSMYWSNSTTARQLEVLFRQVLSKNPEPHSSSCHRPVSCLQRRSRLCHRAHSQIHQAGHVDLRIAGWHSQYVHQ